MQQGNQSGSRSRGIQPRDGTQASPTHAEPDRKAVSPPLVTRGVNSQGPLVDWLRFTGPVEKLDEVRLIIKDYFGELCEGSAGGRYKNSQKIGSASGIFWGSGLENLKDRLMVELTGSTLGELELSTTVDLIKQLSALNLKSTRIDIAVDLFEELDLVQIVRDSISRGELVHAKTVEDYQGYTSTECTRDGLSIGKRGKNGSGRYVRIYDKGVQTKTRSKGEWIRWEVEFGHSTAAFVMLSVLNCTNEQAAKRLLELLYGAIDFREPSDTNLNRRRRVGWYQALINSLSPQLIKTVKHRPDLVGYKSWVSKAVLPKLEKYADELGLSLVALLDYLGEGRSIAPSRVLQSDVFRQLEIELCSIQ